MRATLGQLLFSGDDQKKSLKVISGGEGQRMMIGTLMLGMPNVMLLDEPTNHLDMESIESLNTALDKYTGTLVFVSHDREFVSSLATRVIELQVRQDASSTIAAATRSTSPPRIWRIRAHWLPRSSRYAGQLPYGRVMISSRWPLGSSK